MAIADGPDAAPDHREWAAEGRLCRRLVAWVADGAPGSLDDVLSGEQDVRLPLDVLRRVAAARAQSRQE